MALVGLGVDPPFRLVEAGGEDVEEADGAAAAADVRSNGVCDGGVS